MIERISRARFDVIIVGGGAAGLSAALLLGRCRRRVLVCDAGQPRNAASKHLHCFLSRDGDDPIRLLSDGRAQLSAYPNVEFMSVEVAGANAGDAGFVISMTDGSVAAGRKLLLATGVVDELPAVTGIEAYYGTHVHHCPYCDGWQYRDRPVAVYGLGAKGIQLASMLKLWASTVTLCTNETASDLCAEEHATLVDRNIEVRDERLMSLIGMGGNLDAIAFSSGPNLTAAALFFTTGIRQASNLAARLGCTVDEKGGIVVNERTEETTVPGVYVAGDASRDTLLLIIAAAEGTKAAIAINTALLYEDGLL